MKIVYDRNMPLGEELFSRLGDAVPFDGLNLSENLMNSADLLFIRSTVKIRKGMLDNSKIKFIGSGVIGTDHLDLEYLDERNIRWENAPGCNAESVADYFITALLKLGHDSHITWQGKTLGIIGVGNVGKAVWKRGNAIGMNVIGCDPLSGFEKHQPLEQLLPQCDVVTLHTPLTFSGQAPTHHLFSAKEIRLCKPGAILVNFARGPVIATQMVSTALDHGFLGEAIIDCWENEPDYDAEFAAKAFLATPHVAGYSFEGRVNGTVFVYRKACEFLGINAGEIPELPKTPLLRCDANGKTPEEVLFDLTARVCDIAGDTKRFRGAYDADIQKKSDAFYAMRRNYPCRREFSSTDVELLNADENLREMVRGVGFRVL